MTYLGVTRTAFSLAAAVILLGEASSVAAEDDPWDSKRAAAVTRKLAHQISEIRGDLEKTPPGAPGTTRKKRLELEAGLRLARNSTGHLAKQLEAGKGREETLPIAHQIQNIIRETRKDSRQAVASESIWRKIDTVNDTTRELAGIYSRGLEAVGAGH